MDARLALDLGTTTLAGRLIDHRGEVLAEARCLNPQRVRGDDIIRRLEAALHGDGECLRHLLSDGIASLVAELLHQANLPQQSITVAAACANPAVSTLLCGDDPKRILFPPHRPALLAQRSVDTPILPVPLALFPLVSGYVGGDLVAFLYGQTPTIPLSSVHLLSSSTLYLDLGTNAEMALTTPGGWLATSVAAGPAFEGGGIGCGMLAGTGAIRSITADGDRFTLDVIGGGLPRGLAGSGLFSAVAVALERGLIDRGGRIVSPAEVGSNLSRYLVVDVEGNALTLYRDAAREVRISQQDVRAFQYAKGAVRAGVEALLQRANIELAAVGKVVITGSFGLSLDLSTLKSVAILPHDMVKNTVAVSSGALDGVTRFLLDCDAPAALKELVGRIKPYPLSGTMLFERAFVKALDF